MRTHSVVTQTALKNDGRIRYVSDLLSIALCGQDVKEDVVNGWLMTSGSFGTNKL